MVSRTRARMRRSSIVALGRSLPVVGCAAYQPLVVVVESAPWRSTGEDDSWKRRLRKVVYERLARFAGGVESQRKLALSLVLESPTPPSTTLPA